MATNFLNLLKPDASVGRSSFDLSQKHVFSSCAGQVVPVTCFEVVPNDYLEIDIKSLSRTQTFNTAAMVRGKMTYEVFAVPYSNLWHNFNQFVNQRLDKHSTAFGGIVNTPVIKLGALIDYARATSTQTDMFGMSVGRNVIKLLDMLGYGDYTSVLNLPSDAYTTWVNARNVNGKYVNVFRLAAYQHICYDRFRNKYFDQFDTDEIAGTSSSISPFLHQAYNVDAFNFDDIACTNFSTSQIPVGTSGTAEYARLGRLLTLHYAPWKKDYFTSALPSTQFGAVSSVSLSNLSLTGSASLSGSTGNDFRTWFPDGGSSWSGGQTVETQSNNQSLGYQDASGTWHGIYHTHSLAGSASVSANASAPNAFDVLQLRKAELLQRWKQNTLRAGNQVNDQFRAHFGVTPTDEDDNNVRFLGSFEASLDINSVQATASTGSSSPNNTVGDLAGTGTCVVSGSKVKFTSDNRFFGLVMVVGYFRPEAEYSSVMIDKANTLYEQFDFYTPEFENVGLQPVLNSEYDFVGQSLPAKVIGYVPPYSFMKTAIDKVHAGFYQNVIYNGTTVVTTQNAPFSAWVAPRRERAVNNSSTYGRNISSFYVDPNVLNPVFGLSATVTDQFINNVYVDCKAIRPMSVLGLPQF